MTRRHHQTWPLLLALAVGGGCTDDTPAAEAGTTETTDAVMTFGTETGDGDGDPATGDGDGDASGDGDGDPSGDGDGDPSGDGDGDQTGDGDGDPSGDGDGDQTGDGDGDPSGDGDGDPSGDGDGDQTGDGDGDEDLAPFVVSTSPAELEDGVDPGAAITVSFSEAMDPQTVTANTVDDSCTGAIQLSTDGFATCVQMAAAPSTQDEIEFSLSAAAPLASATSYQLRIQAEVSDAGGTPMAADYTPNDGFVVRYFHTIVLDGVNDFAPEESFTTLSPGHTGYVAWDLDYLYLGMTAPDLDVDQVDTWFVAYLGGMPGSATGVLYNTQEPALPFDARWHVRYNAADGAGGVLEWDGVAWVDAGFGPIPNSDDVAAAGDFVELRLAWAELGDPSELAVHLGMLREQPFNEASWAAVPEGSYMDGYDPDYGGHYLFDVLGSLVPGDHVPL